MTWKSSVAGVVWPILPPPDAATLLAMQWQFDTSQWWSAADLRAMQLRQLAVLTDHAARQIPFHAKRLRDAGIRPGKPIDEKAWHRLPILTRAELRDGGERLYAKTVPEQFSNFSIASSSGSTGVPVRVRKSGIDNFIWQSVHLREELWHGHDAEGMHAIIKGFAGISVSAAQDAALRSADGLLLPDWGPPASVVWATGPMALIHSSRSDQEKAAFLIRVRPVHLSTSPSSLRMLLVYFRDHGLALPSLRSVRTSSERLDDDLRQLCQDIFGCPIIHNYSANEVGYIALQCPCTTQYHIQSETILCEILDAAGQPCAPGQIGRVVVTPLHNFAMPLLRYEIGDEAEVGAPCSCGRGLPVLQNVVGRTADYLTLRSGQRRRVTYNVYRMSTVAAISEYQIVQTSLDEIMVRMVVSRALSAAEMGVVMEIMQAAFGEYFSIAVQLVDALPRTAAGKLRPFVSELPSTPVPA